MADVTIEEKKLNGAGLSLVWSLMKSYLSTAINNLVNVYSQIGHKHTISDITDLHEATSSSGGLLTDAQAQKLASVESNAEVNIVNGIQRNGTDLTPDPTTRVVNISVPTRTSQLNNDDYVVKDPSYVHTENSYTTNEKTKLANIESGAQENIIETVQVNGVTLQPAAKAINIQVPTDNASLSNGAGYQTASDVNTLIDQKVQAMIVPKGKILFAALPTPASTNLGWMWNVVDAFTVDSRFIEYDPQVTKTYPANSNVYVVNDGTEQAPVYKFDVYDGYIDLSNYATLDDVETLTTADIMAICV